MIQNNVYIHVAPGVAPIDALPIVQPGVYFDDQSDDDVIVQAPAMDLQHVYFSPFPVQPSLTQVVHQKTLTLLSKANEQVSKILDHQVLSPTPVYAAAPIAVTPVVQPSAPAIHIDLSDKSWKMFNNETQVHHHYHQENDEKEKNQTGLRVFVGVIGVAIAFATAFFVGKAIAGQEEAQEETESFEELKTQWDGNQALYPVDYQTEVNTLIGRLESIYKREATSRIHKIALLVFAFLAGGTAFAGALAASNVLMAAGVALGVGTAVAALFKLGYSCFSQRDLKDAESIETAINNLSAKTLVVYP